MRAMSSRHLAALAAALLLALPAAGAAQPRLAAAPRAGAAAQADTLALTLADAVARALQAGDEVQLAEAQLDATEAQITSARATALPQLRLQGGYTQVLENARATIVGALFGQNVNYNGNANVSVPLFQGGRAVGAIQGARAVRAASRESVVEASAQVAVDVQRAYLGAIAADELVRIQERNVALSAERLAQVEQLARAGRAARYDVLRARVERANLQPLLIQAQADRELAFLDVKRLLNVPATRPLRLTTSVRTDSAAVLAVLARAAADTQAAPARAAVRGAEASVDARRAAVRVARADLLPTVSVFFQTGVLALPTSPRFPTAWGQASNTLCPAGSPPTRICQNNGFFADRSAGLQFSWPLFDGLRAKGNIDLAQAQQRTAEVQLVQAREQATLEAARARTGVERAGALWQAQRSNTQEAEEAFALATLRFQRGLGTQLEVSDAQFALLTARTNALRATLDVYLAAAELARSLGKPIPLPE
jgi:outer membrane protein TolC